jgi:ParB-like chromosome segregation protein Spo0J
MVRRMVAKGFTHGAIEVRKDGPRLEVVVGRQRVKALRAANEARRAEGLPPYRLRAFVRGVDGADALELLVAENEQRLSDRPYYRAEKCRRLLDMGRTRDDVAMTFGVQLQTIDNWMRFYDLAEDVQAAVRAGRVGFYAALQLADLPREEQVTALEALPPEDGEGEASARTVRAARRKASGADEDGEDVERPGYRRIKRVLAAHREDAFLPDEWVQCLRWVLGEVGDRVIPGLTAAGRKG